MCGGRPQQLSRVLQPRLQSSRLSLLSLSLSLLSLASLSLTHSHSGLSRTLTWDSDLELAALSESALDDARLSRRQRDL